MHGSGWQRPDVASHVSPGAQAPATQRGTQAVLVTSLPLPQKFGTLHGSTYERHVSVDAQSASLAHVRVACTHGPHPWLAPGAKHISKRDGSHSELTWQPVPDAGGRGAHGPASITPAS